MFVHGVLLSKLSLRSTGQTFQGIGLQMKLRSDLACVYFSQQRQIVH